VSSPDELAAALMRAPPRDTKVLSEWLLEGRGRAEAAAYWGVREDAADLMLLRAARALEAALANRAPGPPAEFGLEASHARALADALAGAPPAADLALLAGLVKELVAHRDAVQARYRELQDQYEASPQARNETWGRRLAIVLVLALTAYFYWAEKNRPPEPRRFEERTPIRGR
jgi:hypothetical protein